MEFKRHEKLGICLDAGSGTGPKRPAVGYSAYCDVIPKGKPGVIYPEPYFEAPLEDMSCFEDKQFDWVRSHHSIEHTYDPGKACEEIMRVGKAGIISYPPMWSCMLFGRKDHNYFVTEDHGRLVFIRKRHASYGVPRRDVGTELNRNFQWEGSFKYLVVE
jgi:SAM-dependent methyltransferase